MTSKWVDQEQNTLILSRWKLKIKPKDLQFITVSSKTASQQKKEQKQHKEEETRVELSSENCKENNFPILKHQKRENLVLSQKTEENKTTQKNQKHKN